MVLQTGQELRAAFLAATRRREQDQVGLGLMQRGPQGSSWGRWHSPVQGPLQGD